MQKLNVQLTSDYLQKNAQVSPFDALCELVWNTLDADATLISIKFHRNPLQAIEQITVKDNGHGIYHSRLSSTFGNLGSSEKLLKKKSPLGRGYHGRYGSGRFKALSLGSHICWNSVYNDTDSNRSFKITCTSDEPTTFLISPPTLTKESTGVEIYIEGVSDKASNKLNNQQNLITTITKQFAAYFLAYPGIQLTVDDHLVDPRALIDHEFTRSVSVECDGEVEHGMVRVIRWKEGSESRLYACSASGVALFDVPLGAGHGTIPLSVYLQSEYNEALWEKGTSGIEELDKGFIQLHEATKDIVRDYYKECLAKNAAEAVQKLKKEDVYPYKGEPADQIENAERQVFDICTLKVHEVIPEFSKRSKSERKLTLALIKETLRQRPSALNQILGEVFELSQEQLNEFADLLNKTSLSSMISTTKMVSDRLKFINGLEQILYNTNFLKHLLERSQLHKILLNELWIFGEHYTYGCDDVKLYNVLSEYSQHLGRSQLAANLTASEINDMEDIPDICLWQQYGLGRPDMVENLVIELKRPSKVIGAKEVDQIESYARVVAENSRFPKGKTHWTFLLINTKFDDSVKFKMSAEGRENGCYMKSGNVTIYIRKWGDILTEARARYRYLEDQLKLTVRDNTEGIAFLQQKYAQLLPDQVIKFNVSASK